MKPSELIRQGHCHIVLAEDENGCPVRPESKRAVKWCALGAIAISSPDFPLEFRQVLENRVGNIAHWNDKSSQEKVVKMFEWVETFMNRRNTRISRELEKLRRRRLKQQAKFMLTSSMS